MITVRAWVAGVAMWSVAGLVAAQAPVDPERIKVERADENARAFQEQQITDPTVFVKAAALGGLMQIELAKRAVTKSENTRVKSLAARLRTEFESIQTELTTVARRKKLDVPTSLVYDDEQTLKGGAGKSGEDFDYWYLEHATNEHEKSVALFGAASKMSDADLAAFAKKIFPVIEEQQQLMTALNEAITDKD
jgi:putative membrane protein